MADQPNPFFNTDVTKLLSEFKFPGVDVESVLATQRRNIEALTRANQLAIEGFQTVARRQAEILRGGFEEASSLLRDLTQPQSPQDRVAKQSEVAKKALDRSLSNARELAEILVKAQSEAIDVLNKRLGESIDEAHSFVTKHTPTPAV